MNIKIYPLAIEDLFNGYCFYELQSQGLGYYFVNTLFSDISSLLIYQRAHPIFFDKYYRMLSKRFPFAIYYTSEENEVVIHGVLDCRRKPAWIKQRLVEND